MTRLPRLLCLIALALACQAPRAWTTCQSTPYGPFCTAQVDIGQFAQHAYQTQQASQWCWAASIAMVFAYHGHPVSQQRIVQEAYGSVVNMPAVAGSVMAQALNRSWTDDGGARFASHLIGAYDPAAGVGTLNNVALIQELDRDRPFVVGTNGHAMVVTAMQYYSTPFGPSVAAVWVFDPWPGNGARALSAAEATPIEGGGTMSFVATASVDSDSGGAGSNPMGDTAAGALDPTWLVALACAVAQLLRTARAADLR